MSYSYGKKERGGGGGRGKVQYFVKRQPQNQYQDPSNPYQSSKSQQHNGSDQYQSKPCIQHQNYYSSDLSCYYHDQKQNQVPHRYHGGYSQHSSQNNYYHPKGGGGKGDRGSKYNNRGNHHFKSGRDNNNGSQYYQNDIYSYYKQSNAEYVAEFYQNQSENYKNQTEPNYSKNHYSKYHNENHQKTQLLDNADSNQKKYSEKIKFVKDKAELYGEKKKKNQKGPLTTYKYQDFINQFDSLSEQCVFLTKGICNASIECLICRNPIFQKARIWSCTQCYQPLHLSCIRNWIKSIHLQNKGGGQEELQSKKYKNFHPQINQQFNWTCPNCNLQYAQAFPQYYCFCGNTIEPEFSEYILPHSCAALCGNLKHSHCPHSKCSVLCHPGSCPPCQEYVEKVCGCGKKLQKVPCGNSLKSIFCSDICGRLLDCSKHYCQMKCHEGPCRKCSQEFLQQCYCGSEEKKVVCGNKGYSCFRVCNKLLNCGNHRCSQICHQGECKPCKLSPQNIKTCFCGKESLQLLLINPRKSCTDPIPSCHGKCNRQLPCGHYCNELCHQGNCPPCKRMIKQNCRCAKDSREIECYKINYSKESLLLTVSKLNPNEKQKISQMNIQEINSEYKDEEEKSPVSAKDLVQIIIEKQRNYRCHRPCKILKSCKRHKCQQICCPLRVKGARDIQGLHRCMHICNRDLKCNKHKCPDFCHNTPCRPCKVFSYEPLFCRCGSQTINPPVPCNQQYPECAKSCSLKAKQCGHSCHSLCHPGDCPSCIQVVSKNCNCGKKVLHNVRCGALNLSCGRQCQMQLPCGHKCTKVCHKIGKCFKDIESLLKQGCNSKCNKPRKFCEHRCQNTCHPGRQCPEKPCTAQVRITCQCGFRYQSVVCSVRQEAQANIKCSQQCKRRQRDLKIAKAFGCGDQQKQRQRIELINKSYYPQQMIQWAKKNLSFIQKIETILNSIVYSKSDGISLPQMQGEKKIWVCKLLNDHYFLKHASYGNNYKRIIDVYFTTDSVIPQVLLSDHVKLIKKGVLGAATPSGKKNPFACSLFIYNLGKNNNLQELKTMIPEFKHMYYPENDLKNRGKGIYLHFYSIEFAKMCMKKIKESPNPYTNIKFIQKREVEEKKEKQSSSEESNDDDDGDENLDQDGFTIK